MAKIIRYKGEKYIKVDVVNKPGDLRMVEEDINEAISHLKELKVYAKKMYNANTLRVWPMKERIHVIQCARIPLSVLDTSKPL